LSSIKIGNKVIRNVNCSISNSINSPMLLGQSVLSRFGKYTFDNKNQRLIID
jgi:aspartyl protease family protein